MEIFGPYQLIEKIAVGGMAEIYLARSGKVSGVEKYLIIKRILRKYGHSQRLLELFVNEAKINMNMSHANVVGIFDFGLINGRFYMAMDFVKGLNVHELLKKVRHYSLDKPSIYDVIYIVAQAAKGLSYAHRCTDITTKEPLNIIHKDISPDNILIDIETSIKVIDFGIAAISTEHKSNGRDGKFSYMSPEQALGHKLDQRTDIFSLGSVLWEFLADRKLYNGRTLDEIKMMAENALVTDLKDVNSELPQELYDIVDKALKKLPENRYQDMQTFYNDLNSFLNTHCPSYNSEDLQALVQVCYQEQLDKLTKVMHETKSTNVDTSFGSYGSQFEDKRDNHTAVSLDEARRRRQKVRSSSKRRVKRKITKTIKKG